MLLACRLSNVSITKQHFTDINKEQNMNVSTGVWYDDLSILEV